MRMTTWATKDAGLIKDANQLLKACGWQFRTVVGPQGIMMFSARRPLTPDWSDWDAEMGAVDLAHMVAMVLDLPAYFDE